MEAPITGLHGFHRWADFFKATVSLGLTIAGLLWALLTYGLDGRYAPRTLQEQVAENGEVAKQVGREVVEVRDTLLVVRADLVRDRAFSLRVQSCRAESQDAKRFYAREIGDLDQEFRRITGEALALPACSDLQ